MFRKMNLKKNLTGKSIEKQESPEPIGYTWTFGTLSAYLKEPTGIIIDEIRDQVQNLNVAARKDLGNGGRNPEGRW